ncbi:MAG: hypothetical protein QM783_14605 [Phycisphaerales bacterium]
MRYYTLPTSHSGAIAPVNETEAPIAYWVEGSVLTQPDAVPGNVTVATWSGTLAGTDGPFAADVRNWSQAARSELHDKLDKLVKVAAFKKAEGKLLLRPHARHILNDWHTCSRFMAARALAGDTRTRLLIDPAALLTEQMLARSVEHLERTFEQVGLMLRDETVREQIGGVVISNLRRAEAGSGAVDPLGVDEGEALLPTTLTDERGLLDVSLLGRLARAHLVTGTPVVFVGGSGTGDSQRRLIEG